MGRTIVLCLVVLSVFLFPGIAGALVIEGSVWSIDATDYALHPDKGPPPGIPPEATFQVAAINFDSSRSPQPKNVSFNEFLNNPQWFIPTESKFDPNKKMFDNNGLGNGQEGVFFIFSIPIDMNEGPMPLTIIYDDGIEFSILNKVLFSAPDPVDGPKVAMFTLSGFDPGQYTGILKYGALNDPDPEVLIFRTPEPMTMLLLGLGLVGLAGLRRKK